MLKFCSVLSCLPPSLLARPSLGARPGEMKSTAAVQVNEGGAAEQSERAAQEVRPYWPQKPGQRLIKTCSVSLPERLDLIWHFAGSDTNQRCLSRTITSRLNHRYGLRQCVLQQQLQLLWRVTHSVPLLWWDMERENHDLLTCRKSFTQFAAESCWKKTNKNTSTKSLY